MFPIAHADAAARALFSEMQCFDLYRIVDPLTFEIFEYRGGTLIKQPGVCYTLWKRSGPCHNCSSRRAITINEQVMKLEHLDDRIILVVSFPIELCGGRYVLELAKDVTNSLIINDNYHNNYRDILAMISEFNDLAVRDSFTGLYNKRFIEQELEQNVKQAIAEQSPLTAAIVDIDHFKSVNDTYGHNAGDTVILTIVSYFQKMIHEKDAWIGRLGGDEFLLVFPGCSYEQIAPLCQSIAEKASAHTYEKNGETFFVSISIGVKEFSHCEDHDFMGFLDCVDQEMYRVKREKK